MTVEDEVVGKIGAGLLAFVGFRKGDGPEAIRYLADKLVDLRVFNDEGGRMNLSLRDVRGELLVVSQFTLYGDCRRGRRPGFDAAEEPEKARELYRRFVDYLGEKGFSPREGVFGAMMNVHLVNDGPVTFVLDSSREYF